MSNSSPFIFLVEEEFRLKEPKSLMKYLWITWFTIGIWVFRSEYK